MKSLLKRLVEIAVVLLMTLTVTEVCFRVYDYVRPTPIFYDGSYNRYRGKPHEKEWDGFHLNSHGFKDVEFSPQKVAGQQRIVALGDSFAFGAVPYQHNYLTILEERLNNTGRKSEIINMGIPSIGPTAYLSILQNEGLQLKPDMVLVSFAMGNDFTDVDQSPRPWYSYSHLFSYIKYLAAMKSEVELGVLQPGDVYDDNAPYFTEDSFLKLEVSRSWFYVKEHRDFQGKLSKVVAALGTMKELCDKQGIRFAVVIIPDEVQVNRALQANVIDAIADVGKDRFNFRLPGWLLAQRLDELHIQYLDLLDPIRSGSRTARLYKPRDTHWNIAGNKLAAQVIQKELFDHPDQAPNTTTLEPTTEGFLDSADCGWINGWAWNSARSDDSLHIELLDGESRVASFTADEFRQDLAAAQKGDGYHSFSYPVPPQFRDGQTHTVHLRFAGTQSELLYSPKVIECID